MDHIDLSELQKTYRAVVLCPWQMPRLRGQVDVFGNFISFQEMEPNVVQNYVKIVQPLIARQILMRNSRHGKTLAPLEGQEGVIEPVTVDSVVGYFDQFDVTARDSLVHGDETPDRSFRSEVTLLTRKA